jgi:hypothetical protein
MARPAAPAGARGHHRRAEDHPRRLGVGGALVAGHPLRHPAPQPPPHVFPQAHRSWGDDLQQAGQFRLDVRTPVLGARAGRGQWEEFRIDW